MEATEYLHQYLKNSKLVVIEATGHYPQLSYPGETVSTILESVNVAGEITLMNAVAKRITSWSKDEAYGQELSFK